MKKQSFLCSRSGLLDRSCFVVTLLLPVIFLAACASSSDKEDVPAYKTAGSLSRLELPPDLKVPNQRSDLVIPEISEQQRQSVLKQTGEFEYPPQTQVSEEQAPKAAKPEMKLKSDTVQVKSYKTRMSRNTEGVPLLIIEAEFADIWEHLPKVLEKLGFAIEDKNKADQTYTINKTLTSLRLFEPEKLHGEEQDPDIKEGFIIAVVTNSKVTDRKTAEVKVQDREGRDDASGVASHLLVQMQNILENPGTP